MADAAHVQLLHIKAGWIEGFHEAVEFSGRAYLLANK